MSNLVFNKDAVHATKDHLALLMRLIFNRMKIDNDQFLRLHHAHFARFLSGNRELTIHRNNLRRAMDNPVITWPHFKKMVRDVLHLDIKRLSITVIDPLTGKDVIYNSDDVVEDDNQTAPALNTFSEFASDESERQSRFDF